MRTRPNKLIRVLSWGAGLLLMLTLCGPAMAEDIGPAEVTALVKARKILSFEEIKKKVGKKYPGDVQEVELEREHGAYIYELKILDRKSGIVWKLEVDARSGDILEAKRRH